jgi:hypothetical protein
MERSTRKKEEPMKGKATYNRPRDENLTLSFKDGSK